MSSRHHVSPIVSPIVSPRCGGDQSIADSERSRSSRRATREIRARRLSFVRSVLTSQISLRPSLRFSAKSRLLCLDSRRVRSRPLRTRVVSGMPRRRSAVSDPRSYITRSIERRILGSPRKYRVSCFYTCWNARESSSPPSRSSGRARA